MQTHPHGDPNQEYFNCHPGGLDYVFGNMVRQGLLMKEENKLPSEQFVLDPYSAFARRYDPQTLT